jgi:hypothetical protein
VKYVLYFYISTFRSLCAVPNVAVLLLLVGVAVVVVVVVVVVVFNYWDEV